MNQNSTIDDIVQRLRKEMPGIEEKYRIRSIGVFGSFVREENRSESDLDLLVYFDESPSLLKFLELENYLSDAFWSVGDTNRDRIVSISDMQVLAKSLGTDDTFTHGTDWNQYNADADLNSDGQVDATDLGMAGRSYGKSAG